jgi:hypothetical protein
LRDVRSGSGFAQWWDAGIREVADKLQGEGGVSPAALDGLQALSRSNLLDDDDRVHGDDRTFADALSGG